MIQGEEQTGLDDVGLERSAAGMDGGPDRAAGAEIAEFAFTLQFGLDAGQVPAVLNGAGLEGGKLAGELGLDRADPRDRPPGARTTSTGSSTGAAVLPAATTAAAGVDVTWPSIASSCSASNRACSLASCSSDRSATSRQNLRLHPLCKQHGKTP